MLAFLLASLSAKGWSQATAKPLFATRSRKTRDHSLRRTSIVLAVVLTDMGTRRAEPHDTEP